MIIREILVEPQAIAWLPWAVSYFFFIGLSVSSVFVGLLINRVEKNQYHEFIAVTIALSCAIVAPIALTADLHQPSRIMHFYVNLTPWSWMAWGAIFLPLFTLAVVGYLGCLLRQVIPSYKLPKFCHFVYWGNFNLSMWTNVFRFFSLLLACLILVYTTMEVFVIEARPLWHHYGLMPLILFSAFPTALLLCRFFIACFTQQSMPTYFSHLILMSLIIFIGTLGGLYAWSEQTAFQLTQLWHFSSMPMLAVICLVALSILIYLPHSLLLNIIRLLVALCFTWLVRWILLIQVQSVAKYNALMNPYHLTWHIDGTIGIVSVFSLWLFIGILLWQLLRSALSQMDFTGGKYE
ncbi:NrfD/PsrC family molybdoenzyme membrane anchor subunit [Pasteurella oralis]|uniref:NrfD/PsrC family molybdoenzyme membrane anchor subunit n=1 Tax=Pasteurella oralis TaxID=1071947 RepID=A0ABW4NU67_9PAST